MWAKLSLVEKDSFKYNTFRNEFDRLVFLLSFINYQLYGLSILGMAMTSQRQVLGGEKIIDLVSE